MCVYECVGEYVCEHVCMQVHVSMGACIWVHEYVCICKPVCVRVHGICVCEHACVYGSMYVGT